MAEQEVDIEKERETWKKAEKSASIKATLSETKKRRENQKVFVFEMNHEAGIVRTVLPILTKIRQVINPVLERNISTQGTRRFVKLGDKEVIFGADRI